MKNSRIILAAMALAAATGLFAGPLDGRWSGDTKLQRKNGEKTVAVRLDLSTEGSSLKGSMSLGKRTSEIRDGSVEGDHFTFTTVAKGKKGERKVRWSGSIKGETIEVSRGGKKRSGEAVVLRRS